MNSQLLYGLMMCETDVDGAMRRFCSNEELYVACLNEFLRDDTIRELGVAIDAKLWDEAFTAAHALKGLAGNMGFIPLFHSVGELVILIRTGKLGDIHDSYLQVQRYYNDVSTAIRHGSGAII